ncbi:MAG: DUF362 domain-containing protein [Firmicutes bacterium]|nr:DUF362 domain-containing protein [Bacillota bacterium]
MQENQLMVIYGDDPRTMVETLLQKIKPEEGLPRTAKIGLKPNLVLDKPAASGATTHPELVEGIIKYFQARGYHDLRIMEGSWVGAQTERAFQICGYQELAAQYQVPLINLKRDRTITRQVGALTLEVCASVLEVDYLINLPVLKAHCQTALTCALKNLKGCVPDAEKRRFHRMGLHQPIAHLAAALPTQLTIVDGICGDLTFEEGGNPVPMGRVFAGRDPVLIDAYAASLLGLAAEDVPYIAIAAGLGVGEDNLDKAEIIEFNPEAKSAQPFRLSRRVQSLARYIEECEACSACYGSLIHALHRLEEEGELSRLGLGPKAVKIGQGFRGVNGEGLGVGVCTRGLQSSIPGCPPTARAIKDFLGKLNLD